MNHGATRIQTGCANVGNHLADERRLPSESVPQPRLRDGGICVLPWFNRGCWVHGVEACKRGFDRAQ